VIGVIVFQALDDIILGVAHPGDQIHGILTDLELLIIESILQVQFSLFQFFRDDHRALTGSTSCSEQLAGASLLGALEQVLMHFLLSSLREFIEDAIVQVAVVIELVVLVDFPHSDPELDHLVLVQHELMHRLGELEGLVQVALGSVKRRQNYRLGAQIPHQRVLRRVQVPVREVERLLHVSHGLHILHIILLIVAELLLDDLLLPLIEDVQLVLHLLQPGVAQGALHCQPFLHILL